MVKVFTKFFLRIHSLHVTYVLFLHIRFLPHNQKIKLQFTYFENNFLQFDKINFKEGKT